MSFGNSDHAAYSDLKPLDGGRSLYPISTVYQILLFSARFAMMMNDIAVCSSPNEIPRYLCLGMFSCHRCGCTLANPLKGYTRLDAFVEGLLEFQGPTLVAETGEANS